MLYFRYIAVCHPLKAPVICSRSHVLRVVPTLGVILFATNSHFIWTVHISMEPFQGKEIPQCREKDAFKTLVTEIWPWVDAFIYSFLPFVVISVMNSRIIYSVVIARRGRNRMQSGGQSTLKKPSNPTNGVRRTTNGQIQGGGGQQDTSYRLTFMLLTISCTFLLTTLPVNIIGICAKFLNPKDLAIVTKFKLARTIAELLMYCNHSMNFFLYCATGQKFRQQLLMLICRRRDTSRFTSPSTKIYKSTMNTTIYKQRPKTSIIGSDKKKSLTSHRESKENIIDNTTPDETELKRTLQPEKVPRYTTLAVNKNNYQYTST